MLAHGHELCLTRGAHRCCFREKDRREQPFLLLLKSPVFPEFSWVLLLAVPGCLVLLLFVYLSI
jgi:hypothetical protein